MVNQPTTNGIQSRFGFDNLLVGLYGELKTAKSTFGLTAPRPIMFFDFDDGFERAIWRYPDYKVKYINHSTEIGPAIRGGFDVLVKKYIQPVQWPGQKVKGFLAQWDNIIVPDFLATYNEPGIISLVVDTGTVMWRWNHHAHLERVDKSGARQSLLPVEYGRPNMDMRSLLGASRNYKKNLLVTHHVAGVYEPRYIKRNPKADPELVDTRIGDTWDGWKEMGNVMDVVCHSYNYEVVATDNLGNTKRLPTLPYIIIEECGLTLKAEGKKLDNPSFHALKNYLTAMRSLT